MADASKSLGDGVRWSVRAVSQTGSSHQPLFTAKCSRKQKWASVPLRSMYYHGMELGKGQVCQGHTFFKYVSKYIIVNHNYI